MLSLSRLIGSAVSVYTTTKNVRKLRACPSPGSQEARSLFDWHRYPRQLSASTAHWVFLRVGKSLYHDGKHSNDDPPRTCTLASNGVSRVAVSLVKFCVPIIQCIWNVRYDKDSCRTSRTSREQLIAGKQFCITQTKSSITQLFILQPLTMRLQMLGIQIKAFNTTQLQEITIVNNVVINTEISTVIT